MKEETKKKLCKISKIVGFVITFGFAVFGVLCAAMLIGNGGKKDDIKTLDRSLVLNEVRTERNIKPRKAPDFENGYNLFDESRHVNDVFVNPDHVVEVYKPATQIITYTLGLGEGYYYFDTHDVSYSAFFGYSVSANRIYNWLYEFSQNPVGSRQSIPEDYNIYAPINNTVTAPRGYFYFSGGSVSLSTFRNSTFELYLVDTLEVPPTSSVYLGENWNPLKAFGDTLSDKGGYLLTDENWTANTQTFKTLSISGLVFRYEGVVYDRIFMYARPLNAPAYPYVDSSGAIIERSITQNSGPNEIYVLDYVGFSQSWKQYSVINVMVGGKADTPSPSGKLPYNGSLQWVTSSRTIEIIDNMGITTGRWDNRFASMTDLEFINMLAQYDSEALDVVNGGQMFGLFTNAFDALTPILSIAILPNISLGMILFIPLVGGIIVIIIRLVKK